MEGCRIGRVQGWKSVGFDLKSVRLEGCRIGMCDFMDYIGSIIFGIFWCTPPKQLNKHSQKWLEMHFKLTEASTVTCAALGTAPPCLESTHGTPHCSRGRRPITCEDN